MWPELTLGQMFLVWVAMTLGIVTALGGVLLVVAAAWFLLDVVRLVF